MARYFNAAQVAQETNRHEAVIRRDIKAGKLKATKQGQKWLIAPEEVQRVYGVKIKEPPDPLPALERRIKSLEARLTDALARIEALESRPVANALQTHSQPRQIVPAAQQVHPPTPATPAPSQHAIQPAPKPSQDGAELTRYQAIGFLTNHGAAYSEVNTWRAFPKAREDILHYAKERGQALHSCADDECPCRDLLD